MFASPEVEARMRKTTRQTKKTDEEAIGRTRAEDVPIDVLDTHTIKNNLIKAASQDFFRPIQHNYFNLIPWAKGSYIFWTYTKSISIS